MRSKRSSVPLVVMVALLVALPILALLQYRWIGQVSQADLERLQARLRADTAQFAEEFDGELQRAYTTLQTSEAEAAGLKLVQNLYRIDGPNLLLFDRASRSFKPTDWPPQLEALRRRLKPPPRPPGPPRSRPPGPPRPRPPIGALDEAEGTPVLVAPRFGSPPGPPPPPLVIAELNVPYLEKELLPELVRKHFDVDYAVRIVSRSRVVYQSDAGLAPSFFSPPDGRAMMFDVRPPRPPGPPGPPAPPPPERRSRWEALIKHRSRSLEATVNQARTRNLAVSFAILFVMAAAIAMLLLTTRRAQRLAELQMDFVAGVSHELRTPMAVICSAADNLADGVVGNPAQVRRYGGLIRGEGHRLSQMVEQILRFAGIQAGHAKYDVRPVDVASVIERAVAASQTPLLESGCEMDKRIDPGLPPVMADETSLAHCVGNLIGNALKYGKEGKWVGVSARMADNGTELRISVEDKGPGIEPADLPYIFDPFYRGSRAVSDQIHGAGLGLSLVKRIMEAHGGGVEVASRREGGACFTLRLKTENGTTNSAG
jgi:signal transduction histidine kinase